MDNEDFRVKDIQKVLVIGIDLGGSAIRTASVTKRGRLLNLKKTDISKNRSRGHVVASIIDGVREIEVLEGTRRNKIVAIGIGSPGVIKISKGIIITSPNFPDWKDVPLKSLLEKSLCLPVLLDNDANAAAYGEKWKGAGRKVSSLICMTMGTGIGGGIILDGKVWHGAHGMGGEIGHITVNPEGRLCNCGSYGCLESYSSATGMVKGAIEAISEGRRTTLKRLSNGDNSKITAKMIHLAALKGDRLSIAILKEAGRYLGIGIASLLNTLNPEIIILTGAVTGAWDFFMPAARREIERRAHKAIIERTKIVPGMLPESAGIIGAAGLALRRFGYMNVI